MRYICILLITCLLVQAVPIRADECLTWRLRGENAARTEYTSKGWFGYGFISGFTLGLIGTAITTIAATTSDPMPTTFPTDIELNKLCYFNGYQDKARSKNTISALVGGLVGTAIIVTTLLYISANY